LKASDLNTSNYQC